MSNLIYKICPKKEWEDACENGSYRGSSDDRRDGFIHFSTRAQVKRTLQKHFSRQQGLLLLAVDVSRLNASELIFEGSVEGEKYPHLYGTFSPSAVQAEFTISLNADHQHVVDF